MDILNRVYPLFYVSIPYISIYYYDRIVVLIYTKEN